jgi:hypothetical protein
MDTPLPSQPSVQQAAAVATQYPAVTLSLTFYLGVAPTPALQQELYNTMEMVAEAMKRAPRPQQIITGHLGQLVQ